MAEIVEYCLVVLVSSFFVAGSVVTYASFSSFDSELQLRAAFATMAGLASEAIRNGSAGAAVLLPSSTIACAGGSLSLSAGNYTESENVPVSCDFHVSVNQGSHLLQFSDRSAWLFLSVK
ncbi:MAG TPA: hypothetical protein VEC02_04350 [Nitrososphaerales archaeon]|nr:hypothetical protein [Nitrososphaerales archaeon]